MTMTDRIVRPPTCNVTLHKAVKNLLGGCFEQTTLEKAELAGVSVLCQLLFDPVLE